eukprot:scaffold7_cov414-Pavlova_lutheri.AAC.5
MEKSLFFVETEGDRTKLMLRIAHDIVTLKLRSGASRVDPVTKCAELSWDVPEKNPQAFAVEAQAKLARVCVEACVDKPVPQKLLPSTPAMRSVPRTSMSESTYDAFIQTEETNKEELYKFMATVVQPWPLVHLRQLFQEYQGSTLTRRIHSSSCACIIMKPLDRGQLNTYELVMTTVLSHNICTVKCESLLHKCFNFNVRVSETFEDGSASITLTEIQRVTDFLFKTTILPETSAGANPDLSDADEADETDEADSHASLFEANGISELPQQSGNLHQQVGKMSLN